MEVISDKPTGKIYQQLYQLVLELSREEGELAPEVLGIGHSIQAVAGLDPVLLGGLVRGGVYERVQLLDLLQQLLPVGVGRRHNVGGFCFPSFDSQEGFNVGREGLEKGLLLGAGDGLLVSLVHGISDLAD